jgi:hypothetical protein
MQQSMGEEVDNGTRIEGQDASQLTLMKGLTLLRRASFFAPIRLVTLSG